MHIAHPFHSNYAMYYKVQYAICIPTSNHILNNSKLICIQIAYLQQFKALNWPIFYYPATRNNPRNIHRIIKIRKCEQKKIKLEKLAHAWSIPNSNYIIFLFRIQKCLCFFFMAFFLGTVWFLIDVECFGSWLLNVHILFFEMKIYCVWILSTSIHRLHKSSFNETLLLLFFLWEFQQPANSRQKVFDVFICKQYPISNGTIL